MNDETRAYDDETTSAPTDGEHATRSLMMCAGIAQSSPA
jgi:hypothetical protein